MVLGYEEKYDEIKEVEGTEEETFTDFLKRSPFQSHDLNIYSKDYGVQFESYKDIFELRRNKLRCFASAMDGIARTELISYDYLRNKQHDVLCSLAVNHELVLKNEVRSSLQMHDARPWRRDMEVRNQQYNLSIDDEVRNLLCSRVDWSLEKLFSFERPRDCYGKQRMLS